MKERIFTDAVMPSGCLDAVYFPSGEPAINTLHFNPRQRPGLLSSQQFACEAANRADQHHGTADEAFPLNQGNFDSSCAGHLLLVIQQCYNPFPSLQPESLADRCGMYSIAESQVLK